MNALLVAWSLGILLFGGWGAGTLLMPGQKSLAEMAAHAWLLGGLIISLALALFGTVLSGDSLLGAVTIVSLILGLLGLRRYLHQRGQERPAVEWPLPVGWLEWMLCAVIACQCILLLRFAWTTAIGWDGLMVWESKARIAFSNGGRLPVAYFPDVTRVWTHSNYPLMIPLIETWVYLWLGACNQFWVRVIFPFFYFAALILLYSGAAQVSGRRWVGLLTASLLFFVPFVTVSDYNVFTGYADFPLAVFYLAAVVYLIRFARDPAHSWFALFAVYAGALPWIKQEGTFLWLFAMLVAAVEFVRKAKPRLIVLTALPGIIVIVGWKVALHWLQAIQSQDYLPITAANVIHNAPRIGTIADAVVLELCTVSSWSLLWIILPIALLWVWIEEDRGLCLTLAGVIFIPLGFYSGIYVLSSWNPFQNHIACSLPRLVSGLSLVAVLTLGLGISALAKRKIGLPKKYTEV